MGRGIVRGPSLSVPRLLSAAGALPLAVSTLYAQTPTGRIEGQVEASAGVPLAAVQVYVLGTAFGALTDPRGHYFINQVPAGTYDLRAVCLGYRPVKARGLRGLAGQTVTQDFALEAAPVVLRELEVVGGKNLLVPRDEVTTTQRVQGEFLEHLPVDRLNDVLALQPGCLIRAEERYGDGDHVFTLSEQRRASDAFYRFERGLQRFTDDPRQLRLGLEVTFC